MTTDASSNLRRHRFWRRAAAGFTGVLGIAIFLPAQDRPGDPAENAMAREVRTEQRVYNISDLIYEIPDFYSAAAETQVPSGGSGGGSLFSNGVQVDAGKSSAELVEDIKQLIQRIRADSWSDRGGSEGTIIALGTTLLIDQTPETWSYRATA